MRYLFYIAVILCTIVFWYGVVCITQDVFGSEVSLGADVRWNCENMKHNPHPIPVNFWTDNEGNWEVFLSDWTRVYGTRYDGYMKWVWQDAWWHTNGIDVVYCESDAKALSILLYK